MQNQFKVCVVTGARAEYGLLKHVIRNISSSDSLCCQVLVTGSHLSPEFGMTVSEISDDSILIDKKVEMLLSSDSPIGVAKSMGLGMIGIADAFDSLSPDLVLLLGDRFEIFAAASAAMVMNIPIAHCHGGELTEGAVDDPMRHAITKMSALHFVAADEYRKRVIQLGENPRRVFNVGGLGVDALKSVRPLSRQCLESDLDFNFQDKNLLVTFHPETALSDSGYAGLSQLLVALSQYRGVGIIFTLPNADSAGRAFAAEINRFCSENDFAKSFTSLGFERYASCMAIVDGVVGNSSSGLLEAPAFHLGTINIGNRQLGRMKAKSVIDVPFDSALIADAIDKLFSDDFRSELQHVVSPYGSSGAAERIVSVIESLDHSLLLDNSFHDI